MPATVTVALSPTGDSYASGTVVTLTATGNTGYVFSAWSGDVTGSTNPTTITVDGDKTVTATFAVAPPWTAYNDCSGTNSIANTTSITIGSGTTGTAGVLKNFSYRSKHNSISSIYSLRNVVDPNIFRSCNKFRNRCLHNF